MVAVTKKEDNFIFKVKSLHQFWAFKSKIVIPKDHIVKVYQDHEELSKWSGWKMPGTCIPFLITAGTFYLKGSKNFWDVVNKENTIIVEIINEEYNKLIIEVENPTEIIHLLNSK